MTALSLLSNGERDGLPRRRHPTFAPPMLATLTDDRFSDPDWIYERKLDGERVLAIRDGDKLRLLSRNRKALNHSYPELVEALAQQQSDRFAVDGEVVAFEGKVTSFQRLQQRMQVKDADAARRSGVAIKCYLFDLMHLDGRQLEGLPLGRRKALLRRAFSFDDPLRFTAHRRGEGEAFFREACEKGWEGIIAKRDSSPYVHSRSRDWLKFKCTKGQELVIGGFTEPKGSREGFGALLVGYYDKAGELHYAGKVGTGFDEDTLADLRERMDALRRDTSPFADEVREGTASYVTPKLVGEFGFTEWTRSGKLRHPRFLGLRRDKAAEDVVREEPSS